MIQWLYVTLYRNVFIGLLNNFLRPRFFDNPVNCGRKWIFFCHSPILVKDTQRKKKYESKHQPYQPVGKTLFHYTQIKQTPL